MHKLAPRLDEIVHGSLPSLASCALSGPQRDLLRSIPVDYRRFLDARNGGRVDEFALSFDTGVPFRTEEVDNPSRDDGVREFFGFRPRSIDRSGGADDDEVAPADLLAKRVHHDQERFLPLGVIAIAVCVSSSLVCTSLRPEDHGLIYYWDWYWQYPWCKWFFEERVAAVRARFPDAGRIATDTPWGQELIDALNFATLVPLADTFADWISRCTDASAGE